MHAGPLFEGLRAKGLLQRGLMYFEEGLHTSKRVYTLERGPTHFKEPRGPTYFKEGLRTSKRAYVLQRGSSSSCLKRVYTLERGPTHFKEGLRTSKRAYLNASKRAYVLQRGPSYFEEGLRISKRACVLQRGPTRTSTGASVLQKAHICEEQFRANEGLTVLTGAYVLQTLSLNGR